MRHNLASALAAIVATGLMYGCASDGQRRDGGGGEIPEGKLEDISRFIQPDGSIGATPAPTTTQTDTAARPSGARPSADQILAQQPTAGVDPNFLRDMRGSFDIVSLTEAPAEDFAFPHANVHQAIEYYREGDRNPYGLASRTATELKFPELIVASASSTVEAWEPEYLLVFYPEDNTGARLPWRIELRRHTLRTNLEGVTLPNGKELLNADVRWVAVVPERLSRELRDGHSYPSFAFGPKNLLVTGASFSNHSDFPGSTAAGSDMGFVPDQREDGTWSLRLRHIPGRPSRGPQQPLRIAP